MSYQSTPLGIASAIPAARIPTAPPPLPSAADGVLLALARLLAHRIDITQDDLVADLCCGSGRFTRAFARVAALRTPLVAVDARAFLLAQLRSPDAEIRTSLMDPLEFARFPASYDCILMKDAFDQVRDPRALFLALRGRLEFGGRLAVVQSLSDSHADPLLEILRSRGIEQVDASEVAELQHEAGFSVTRSSVQLREVISWSTYLQRISSLCLPVLHYLKAAELMLGIDAMRTRHAPQERVEIVHRFDLALGLCR
jgi:SAM-dependent methyltransferase